ncbi:hypothetical protein EV356DRAFT_474442 [Viridothelium virens]|uniref:Putative lipoate-protein ligase A n=1 Tax=Viridothelium virens TaxID=1048519 RepID=A0A6A6GX96_VIRVR|nr:hypothetical protein EV356DRAFT_474442 [Viridothelium virens]
MPSPRTAWSWSAFSSSLSSPSNRSRSLHASLSGRVTSAKVQTYLSNSEIPFLNLAFEQHLLANSPADSVILFFYVNRPSIIIGSNQNPWLEVNLRLLRQSDSPVQEHVDLARRHSGGGTVFHDRGNVNWTVICPSNQFTRDKHAEMVVRALRKVGVERARVNERHDIVLDQGDRRTSTSDEDTHKTPFTSLDAPASLKVSGSAYKLTRGRALHHGTCLLHSPNLDFIGRLLRSPAKPFVKARGVESVSSPVGNIGVTNSDFIDAVHEEFARLYDIREKLGGLSSLSPNEMLHSDVVRDAVSRLKDLDWIFARTPQFELSTSERQSDQLPEKLCTVPSPKNVRWPIAVTSEPQSLTEYNSRLKSSSKPGTG